MSFNTDRFGKFFALYFAVGIGLAAMLSGIYVFAAWITGTGEEATRRVFLMIILRMSLPAALVAAVMAFFHETGTGSSHDLYAGSGGVAGPPLDLSVIRGFVKREEFDAARAELDREWGLYPGNGELLREYDHLFEALHAPSGAVAFYTNNLHAVSGDDRAYALLRLAEISADVLKHPLEARSWCRRLVAEFPDSPLAGQARAMLAELPPAEGSSRRGVRS